MKLFFRRHPVDYSNVNIDVAISSHNAHLAQEGIPRAHDIKAKFRMVDQDILEVNRIAIRNGILRPASGTVATRSVESSHSVSEFITNLLLGIGLAISVFRSL